jgi:D-psicose/D-tagatose/L-ribulose 3-epimerase
MKFGVNTFLWTAAFGSRDFALIEAVRERGFDGIEVALIRPEAFEASAIRKALGASGLACTVCSVLPRELSLISEDAAVRKKTLDHLSACIKATAETGANILAGPLYSPVGHFSGRGRTSDEWKRAVNGYQQLGPVLASYRVQLFIEPLNRFETYFLNTTVDTVRICEEVGDTDIGILWDTFTSTSRKRSWLKRCA